MSAEFPTDPGLTHVNVHEHEHEHEPDGALDDVLEDGVYYVDDMPDDMMMDHPPLSAHSTYIMGDWHGLEKLDFYEKDGYHPVHLGDRLGESGRYRVIHKLGYGGFGTVWLCRDDKAEKYVAVKVMASDMGEKAPNGPIDLALEQLDRSEPGAEYLAFPLDHFTLRGPNGTHQCVVLLFLGPCVSPRIWQRIDNYDAVLRNMSRQVTQALAFLHRNGICHGDFRPANILVRIKDLSHLSEDEIMTLLGAPDITEVLMESGHDLPESAPKYVVRPVDLSELSAEYLTDQICVVDFSEVFPTSSPPRSLGIPEHYLPPEMLVEDGAAVNGLATDIWALANTLYEIRYQLALLHMIDGPDAVLAETVRILGKLPDPLWAKWENRGDYFTEDGKDIRTRPGQPDRTLAWYLDRTFERRGYVDYRDGTKVAAETLAMPKDEQKTLGDLLRKLFCYEPGDRLSAEDALKHEYFKF